MQTKLKQTIQIQKNGTKGETKDRAQMRGEAVRQTRAQPAKVTRRTADKVTAKPYTKISTEADKSGYERTDKGAARGRGQRKDKERTQSSQRLGQSQNIVRQRLEALPKPTQGGHEADTRRTSCGDAARAYRGKLFFLRQNPTVNCLGKN